MRWLVDEVRLAARMLAKNRGFAFASVLTLVLGITLNTAVFSVANAIWFRPLPFRAGGEIIHLGSTNAEKGLQEGVSRADYKELAGRSDLFEGAAAFQEKYFNFTINGAPERAWGGVMSHNATALLGIEPILGRGFAAAEDNVVLIGENYWRGRLNADPRVIGREARLDGRPVTVVGVLPRSFRFVYTDYEVIAPLSTSDGESRSLSVLARLRPGVHVDRLPSSEAGWVLHAVAYRDLFARSMRDALVLLAAAGLVLLIVCANVSNLFLAKSAARRRETAIRLAIGAGRRSIVRQMLVEGVVVGLISGGVSAVLSIWLRDILIASFPQVSWMVIDFRVFGYMLLVSVAAGLVFGIGPALALSRTDFGLLLRSAAPGTSGVWLRKVLVVSELAIGLMLLAGTGLLLQSMVAMRFAPTGMNTEDVLVAEVALEGQRYADPAARVRLVSELTARMNASAADVAPLCGGAMPALVTVEGRNSGDQMRLATSVVDAGYLPMMGVPLLAGTGFEGRERADGPAIALVNEAFVKALWPRDAVNNVVGRRIRVGEDGSWLTIAGVVANARQAFNEPPHPHVFRPFTQAAPAGVSLMLRTTMGQAAVAAALRAELAALDPDLPVRGPSRLEDLLENYSPMTVIYGVGTFALVATALAVIGLYGVISYLVVHRTREIGVRLALGASRAEVVRMVLGQSLRLAVIGGCIGILGALGLARVLAHYLPGVSPADPWVFSGVTLVLLVVAALAGGVPALRACRVDPAVALRYD